MAGKETSQNMSKTQERVIKLISKPSSQRTNMEIDFVLPWLKKMSDVFLKISNAILKDIVRNCDFVRTEKDDIIIRQGDTGDCLYILLRGSVSVFIKETAAGDDLALDNPAATDLSRLNGGSGGGRGHHLTKNWQQIAHEICEDLTIRKHKKTERANFGKKIVTIGAGKAFGEIALLTADSIRTASILSDESCDLMVVNRKLFNSTLKSFHEKDFEERRQFIEHSPLFRSWNPRMKKQLERSLIKEYHSTDTCIIRQEDRLKGLVFIREGHAKVLVEPGKHKHQYPHMAPFPTENNLLDVECLRGRKLRRSKSSPDGIRDQSSCSSTQVIDRPVDVNQANQAPPKKPLTFEQIHVKRTEGYAAAERRITHKSVILCTVREGAMFGDIEMSQNLKTYSQTVVTLVPTETYSISSRNVERLIQKRSPNTMKKLLDIVLWKMCNRATSVQGNLVPLIHHLVFKMENNDSQNASRILPPIQGGKQIPQGDRMLQNLVEEYLNDKAQLIVPYVPGGVYYKTVMRKRAAERAKVRRRREKIRLEVMEKELRHQIAKTINFQKVIETGWNLSASEEDTSTSEEDDVIQTKETKVQNRITPRIFSQSDPALSRPNSSRKEEQRAFMTEVEERGESEAAVVVESEKGEVHNQPKLAAVKGAHTVKTKNFTVCLVYDEASGSSSIKHYGPSASQLPSDALSVFDDKATTRELNKFDSSSEDDEVFTRHPVSDSKLVGADKYLKVSDHGRRVSGTGTEKRELKRAVSGISRHIKSPEEQDSTGFLPSISITVPTKADSKWDTDDDSSQPMESARHSFSAPQNSRVRTKSAHSLSSRRKSESLVPLPIVTSSKSAKRPAATFIANFVNEEGDRERKGHVIHTGESYMDIVKQTPPVINAVS